jgi:transposase
VRQTRPSPAAVVPDPGHRGRVGARRRFSERGYADLLRAAHHQLGGRTVLVWDNLGVHLSRRMRAFVAAHADWLTVIQLPAYAPDLNPTEGVWGRLKTSLGSLAVHGLDDLDQLVRTRLKRMQYRPHLINGFLAGTGLNLNPVNPSS